MPTLIHNLADTLAEIRERAPNDAWRTTAQLARQLSMRGMCRDEPDIEDVHEALKRLYEDRRVDFTALGWRWRYGGDGQGDLMEVING